MALEITTQGRIESGGFISAARLCLTADNQLVQADDPRAVRLLVGEGGSLPLDVAERYGLVVREQDAVITTAAPQFAPPIDPDAERIAAEAAAAEAVAAEAAAAEAVADEAAADEAAADEDAAAEDAPRPSRNRRG